MPPLFRAKQMPAILFISLSLPAVFLASGFFGEFSSYDIVNELDRLDPEWRLEDLERSRRVVSDQENSALVMLAINRMLVKSGFNHWLNREASFWDDLFAHSELSSEQLFNIERKLAEFHDASIEARKLEFLSNGRFPDTAWRNGGIADRLDAPWRVATFLFLQMSVQIERRNFEAAASSCLSIINATRSFGDEPRLVCQLARNGCRNHVIRAVERLLALAHPSKAALAALQTALEKEAEEPILRYAIRGERAVSDREFSEFDPEKCRRALLTLYTQLLRLENLPPEQQATELEVMRRRFRESQETSDMVSWTLSNFMVSRDSFGRAQGHLKRLAVLVAEKQNERQHFFQPDD